MYLLNGEIKKSNPNVLELNQVLYLNHPANTIIFKFTAKMQSFTCHLFQKNYKTSLHLCFMFAGCLYLTSGTSY